MVKHKFINSEFFNIMKNEHLVRVKDEISVLKGLMQLTSDNENLGVKKEIQLSIISFLLRRCDELEYIHLGDFRFKLNSILHAHKVLSMKNGDMHLLSDDDLQKNRKGVKVDSEFIEDLIVQIDSWLIDKLK